MLELKKNPALVIIDMQNGFCHPEGTFGKMGMPVQNHLDVVPTINRLRAQSHASNVPVFFTRLWLKDDYSDAGIQTEDMPQLREMKAFVGGTWDADVLDDLKPDPKNANETVINKTRNTAFWGTDFSKQLGDRGVDQLLVTGVGTNVCVESTVRDAVHNDIYCKTISDATATLTDEEHRASLKNLTWFGGVASSEEVLEALRKRESA